MFLSGIISLIFYMCILLVTILYMCNTRYLYTLLLLCLLCFYNNSNRSNTMLFLLTVYSICSYRFLLYTGSCFYCLSMPARSTTYKKVGQSPTGSSGLPWLAFHPPLSLAPMGSLVDHRLTCLFLL